MNKSNMLFLFILFFVSNFYAQNTYLLRYPAINNDGTKIAFCYQGDIWTVDSKGGNALRLTVHEAYDAMPRFSYDGTKIAFNSNRYGNNDLFIMPVEGGMPERLTYHSANDIIGNYSKNGEILFTTSRNYKQVEWNPEIYAVNEKGGTPYRLTDAFGTNPEKSPNGRFIAYGEGITPLVRNDYRGSANKDIYLFDTKNNKYIQITKFNGNDFYPRWANDNTIYYLSSENEYYNIYKLSIDNEGNALGNPTKITDYTDDNIRYFDLSSNGNVIVFEKGTGLFLLTLNGSKAKLLDIKISEDYKTSPIQFKTLTNGITEYNVSPNGKYSSFVIRGEIFVSENNKDKSKTVNITKHPYRDTNPTWLNDTTIIFVSDRYGKREMFLAKSGDVQQPNFIKSLKFDVTKITDTKDEEYAPVVSPDGKKIAFIRNRGELIVGDINKSGKITNEKELLNNWSAPNSVTWSPDSKYLAYSMENLEANEEVYIQPADNSAKPFNLTMHPRQDYSPVFSQDGSKLGFISTRNNDNADIWFVWLKQKDWEKTKQDWDDTEEDVTKKDTKKGKDSVKTEPVVIDFENIRDRFVQVTSLPGNESDLAISKDGKTFYYVTNRNSRYTYKADQDLFSIKWDGKDVKQLTSNNAKPSGVSLDPTGKFLFMLKQRGTLSKLDIGSSKEEVLPFVAEMKLDFNQEKKQKFDEAWRVINLTFYDPKFHNNNWQKLREKYEPLALIASTDEDFRDVINMMMGELNASHMGIYGVNEPDALREVTGLLGVEIRPLKKGVKIEYVIPNSPADKTESELFIGDLITSVNGSPVDENTNFYSLFTNTADKQVYLEVENLKNEKREVIIRPINSLRDLQYKDWVATRQKLVEKYSNGKLGYIHIQGMDWQSFERFESELAAQGEGKDGLIIDVRYNGGGWTTDFLLNILTIKQHAYTIPRGSTDNLEKNKDKFKNVYAYSERLPFPVWTKPSITMCNFSSYSNAEIFSHAYKTLNIGKLVGTPTFGAVISTGAYSLINGSTIRTPGRAWFSKGTDINMENNPAVPDIIIDNPQDYRIKEDTQLKIAVDELLKGIK